MEAARGLRPAQTLFTNLRWINVFTGVWETESIAVLDGVIVGVGDYQAEKTVDLQGAFVAPGLIDGHVHIESSMLVPHAFARIVLPKGTTSVVADPHEIANVCGRQGIEYMLKDAKLSPLSVFLMIPSCVPATPFETAGARLEATDIRALKNKKGILGLGEVMDYPAVLSSEEGMKKKLLAMKDRVIDGHSPGLVGKDLQAYVASGIQTDHESSLLSDLEERVRLGMYVHLREGSQTRNVSDLLPGVTEANHRRLLFCTDDKHPSDILEEGHINFNVNLALAYGIDFLTAIRMATINVADAYGLSSKGAIAPGRDADFIVFDDRKKLEPKAVYVKGLKVAEQGKARFFQNSADASFVRDTIRLGELPPSLDLKLKSLKVHVIGLIENNVTTTDRIETVKVEKGRFVHDEAVDILKLCVFERHTASGRVGMGLVKGYGLKNGAIAMSVAHDSHNVIAIGSSDEDIRKAVQTIASMEGGIAVVSSGTVLGKLRLEIAGLMTEEDPLVVKETLERLDKAARKLGVSAAIADPFLQLAFLALPVIPDLKLTDYGLFDVKQFRHIEIEANE
jgi:adenine deaminase